MEQSFLKTWLSHMFLQNLWLQIHSKKPPYGASFPLVLSHIVLHHINVQDSKNTRHVNFHDHTIQSFLQKKMSYFYKKVPAHIFGKRWSHMIMETFVTIFARINVKMIWVLSTCEAFYVFCLRGVHETIVIMKNRKRRILIVCFLKTFSVLGRWCRVI